MGPPGRGRDVLDLPGPTLNWLMSCRAESVEISMGSVYGVR